MTETLLATVAELAAYRGTSIADDDPAALFALAGASAEIRSYTGQTFDLITEDVLLDGTGTAALLLPQMPVVEVDYAAIIGAGDTETEVTDFTVDAAGILWRGNWACWPLGHRNIAVSYKHGYASVPSDVAAFCVELAFDGLSFENAQAVTSEQIGTYQVTYADTSDRSTSSRFQRLDHYRFPTHP